MKKITKTHKDPFDGIFGKGEQAIKHDAFDKNEFEDVKNHSARLLQTEEEMAKEYEQYSQLQQDLFSSFYKYVPELEEDFKLKKEFLMNKEIMRQIMEMQRYKELRVLTKLDKIHATIGTEAMAEEVKEILKKLKEQMEAFQEMMDAANDLQESADGDKKGKKKDGEEDKEGEEGEEGAGKNKMTIEEAKAKLEEAKKNFKESMEKSEVKRVMERAVGRVRDTVKESSEFIENWGLGASDSFQKKPYHEKMELIERLRNNSKLQQIAKLAGKYKRMMLQRQYEKVKKGVDEVYSIIPGQDLSRLLPSELMKLQNELTEKQFMIDYLEGRTLQYDLRGKEKKCKGAIVCCIDESGSMNGLPEIWAKAVALTLLEIAKAQKRNFFCIHFDANPKDRLHTNIFLKDHYGDVDQIIDMAEYFTGGDTLFEPPLELAKDQIMMDKEFSKADIIFVTDGESVVTDSFLTDYLIWKKEKKVSIFSILIDSYCNNPVVLKSFSDEVRKVSDLKDDADDLALTIIDGLL